MNLLFLQNRKLTYHCFLFRVDKAEFDKLKRSSSGPLRSTTLKSARAGRGASPTHRDRSRSPIQRSRSPMNVRSRSPRSRSPLMHPSRGRSNGKRVDDWHARPASPSDRRSGNNNGFRRNLNPFPAIYLPEHFNFIENQKCICYIITYIF